MSMDSIKALITFTLLSLPLTLEAQENNPDLYDAAGEFAFARIQYDSYYDGGWYGCLLYTSPSPRAS